MTMKYYVITIEIRYGEYDKDHTRVVRAEDLREAVADALEDEAHGELEYEEGSSTVCYDLGGEFRYRVTSHQVISEEDYYLLRKYI